VHEVRVDVGGGGGVGVRAARRLVRVVDGGQSAEARLDLALGGVERDAQVGVEGAGALDFVVGLVDRVEQVQGDDEDVDAPAVLGKAGRAGLRLGVAGADRDAVVEGLRPACDELYIRRGDG
jgi:hypothetical protein